MANFIKSDNKTVYMLNDKEDVYLLLRSNELVFKVSNYPIREEGSNKLAKGSYTYGIADTLKGIFAPKTVEKATNVINITENMEEIKLFNQQEDALVLDIDPGENCAIAFLEENNVDYKGGYIVFTNESIESPYESRLSAGSVKEILDSNECKPVFIDDIKRDFAMQNTVKDTEETFIPASIENFTQQ